MWVSHEMGASSPSQKCLFNLIESLSWLHFFIPDDFSPGKPSAVPQGFSPCVAWLVSQPGGCCLGPTAAAAVASIVVPLLLDLCFYQSEKFRGKFLLFN